MPSTRTGARRFAIAIILLICLGASIAELCDRWDQTFQDDTESHCVVVALCVGLALSLAGGALARLRYRPTSGICVALSDVIGTGTVWIADSLPGGRLPTTLRI
jgi:hypothetical protein